jgi:hypothetical protein
MYCVYRDKTKKDPEFKIWSRKYRKTCIVLPIFGLLFSFRAFKFFFSGFFGLENCMAHMEDPGNNLIKHIKRISIFVFIMCYTPAFVAAIISFVTVHWGYQIMICAIETIILYFTFVILFILELIFE